jgi:hypothetical protein
MHVTRHGRHNAMPVRLTISESTIEFGVHHSTFQTTIYVQGRPSWFLVIVCAIV